MKKYKYGFKLDFEGDWLNIENEYLIDERGTIWLAPAHTGKPVKKLPQELFNVVVVRY